MAVGYHISSLPLTIILFYGSYHGTVKLCLDEERYDDGVLHSKTRLPSFPGVSTAWWVCIYFRMCVVPWWTDCVVVLPPCLKHNW